MVQASHYGDAGIGGVSRCVYKIAKKIELMERSQAIDANDPIVVLAFGKKSEYIAPYTKDTSDKKNIVYDPSIEQTKTRFKG